MISAFKSSNGVSYTTVSFGGSLLLFRLAVVVYFELIPEKNIEATERKNRDNQQ